jgi:hypothetical protein
MLGDPVRVDAGVILLSAVLNNLWLLSGDDFSISGLYPFMGGNIVPFTFELQQLQHCNTATTATLQQLQRCNNCNTATTATLQQLLAVPTR